MQDESIEGSMCVGGEQNQGNEHIRSHTKTGNPSGYVQASRSDEVNSGGRDEGI